MPKTTLLLNWLNEAFGKKNLTALDDLMTKDGYASGAMTRGRIEKSELQEFILTLRNLIGPIRFSLLKSLEQDDWLAARINAETSSLRTGYKFDYTDHIMVRFEGDKLAEVISQSDYFALFENLGQLPSDALAACMAGQVLR